MNEKQKQFLKGFVEKSKDSEDGVLNVAVASSASVDRMGEIIDQDGWDLSNFKKNPQLLWMHNIWEDRPPIGKVDRIWLEGEGKKKKLMFKAVFDMADDFAREIYRKYVDGFLNAFSVGFIGQEMDGNTYTKSELLEISAVAVPANPQALVQLRNMGFKATQEWADIFKHSEPSIALSARETFEKLALGLGNEWEKSFESVARAMAILMGAKGGLEINETELEGVYNYVSDLYKKFEKEPPQFKLIQEKVLKDLDELLEQTYKTIEIKEVQVIVEKEVEKKVEEQPEATPNKNFDVEHLREILRITDQAVGIALKNLKSLKKGGE